MGRVSGKICIVTGGASGLGKASAAALCREGARVMITDLNETLGHETAAEIGENAVFMKQDVAEEAEWQAIVAAVMDRFGRLDVLVNNAGTAIPKAFEETTIEEMDRVIDINVRGILATTQAALKHMKSGGRIIMIGSAVGERVLVPGLVAYSSTKGAVKIFTQALSRELGSRGITVNNIQPGPIDTDLNPATGDWAVPQKAATSLDRYGRVDEIAAMVAFVAGPESSYITGSNLTVDG